MSYIFDTYKYGGEGEPQTLNNISIHNILDTYTENLIKQFQAGDISYKDNKDVGIKNFKDFYDQIITYNTADPFGTAAALNSMNMKDYEFIIKEIEDIRGVSEPTNRINVVFDNQDENDPYFKYSDALIVTNGHESFNDKYKKIKLVKNQNPKKCVFGTLYPRTKKDVDGANGRAHDTFNKSFEYLDLSGYVLYDYVHNYPKYKGNPICKHLNDFLEERILELLDINNDYLKNNIEELRTFTLYDIIYPNAHYIYNIGDKNFCLPIDRVICHYDETPANIGANDNIDYNTPFTISNFIQDIFGMSIGSIDDDIKKLFIKCLNKKLLNMFTNVEDGYLFYGRDITLIYADILALFAFFIVLNDKLNKNQKLENILKIEVYKSFELLKKHGDNIDNINIISKYLPFIYTNASFSNALLQAQQHNVARTGIIQNNGELADLIDNNRNNTLNYDSFKDSFQYVDSYLCVNNYQIVSEEEKNDLYKFIFDSMLRIGKYGMILLKDKIYNVRICRAAGMTNNNLIIEEAAGAADLPLNEHNSFRDICIVNASTNANSILSKKYVFSSNEGAINLYDKCIDLNIKNFHYGIGGLFMLQTIYLNSIMRENLYDTMITLYNLGLKFGFAQYYIYKHLIKKYSNIKIISDLINGTNMNDFQYVDSGIYDTDRVLKQIFKSLFLDSQTYDSILKNNVDGNAGNLKIDRINIYSQNKRFDDDQKQNIFLNLLEYYNNYGLNIINFKSKDFKIHSKKYHNNEILLMIKKLTQNKLNLFKENKLTFEKTTTEETKLLDEQKNRMLNIFETTAKNTGVEDIDYKRLKNITKPYGPPKEIKPVEDAEDTNNNGYNELLLENNLNNLIFKGGVDVNMEYNCSNDIYCLLLLNYYNKLTTQKLKYYYLFNILMNLSYFVFDIAANNSYIDANAYTGKYNIKENKLFITERYNFTQSVRSLLDTLDTLVYYYFFGINFKFIKGENHNINTYAAVPATQGNEIIKCEKVMKKNEDGDYELDQHLDLFKYDTIKKVFNILKNQLPNNISNIEKNKSKQNINQEGQTMQHINGNNSGIYSMTDIPKITKQNLTEGNNINVSFLNNNGLLPFLISRNLNKEILKGGEKLFDQTANVFALIRNIPKSRIIEMYKKGKLNVEQMAFLNNAKRIDEEREKEYKLIIGVINYIRRSISKNQLKNDEGVLKRIDEIIEYEKNHGWNSEQTIEGYNLHYPIENQVGGEDMSNILTKLKQGQYRRQQIDNDYIEKLNQYTKNFRN